jgi:hypothetical protein
LSRPLETQARLPLCFSCKAPKTDPTPQRTFAAVDAALPEMGAPERALLPSMLPNLAAKVGSPECSARCLC